MILYVICKFSKSWKLEIRKIIKLKYDDIQNSLISKKEKKNYLVFEIYHT